MKWALKVNVLAWISALLYTVLSTNCGGGWKVYSGNCYLFNTNIVSYTYANFLCKRHSANLVSIHSQDENDFIWKETQVIYSNMATSETSRRMFWIGYSYDANKALYSWIDGSIVDYGNWKGQTSTDVTDGNSHFATICNDPLWCDVIERSHYQYYICKKSSEKTLPRHCPHESVYDPSTLHCYVPLNEETTWSEANDTCHSIAASGTMGYIMTVNSLYETFFLGAFPTNIKESSDSWVNLQDIDGDGRWFADTCRNPLFFPRGWMEISPKEACAGMDIHLNEWQVIPCDLKMPVICEIEEVNKSFPLTDSCSETSTVVQTTILTTMQSSWESSVKIHVKRGVTVTSTPTTTNQEQTIQSLSTTLLMNKFSKCNSSDEKCNSTLEKLHTVTTQQIYKKKQIKTVPPSAEPAHVAVGALGVLLFIILIGAVFISDFRMLFMHVTRGVDVSVGSRSKPRVCIHKTPSCTSSSVEVVETSVNLPPGNNRYVTTSTALKNMGLV